MDIMQLNFMNIKSKAQSLESAMAVQLSPWFKFTDAIKTEFDMCWEIWL